MNAVRLVFAALASPVKPLVGLGRRGDFFHDGATCALVASPYAAGLDAPAPTAPLPLTPQAEVVL